MQTEADTGDGFVVYDELRGPDLEPARWSPARLPLPTGEEHVPLDPNAELAVGDGEVRVTIPRFSLAQSIAPRAGPERTVAPVPSSRGRRLSLEPDRVR